MPWRERFKPGGAFDERFEIAVSQADNAAGAIAEPSTSSDRFDARGVVKAVRVSSGKLKISHGPIERFGMPGMTMLFGVADVSMLDQVGKDDEVEFAVENTEAGFVITEIRRTEGGQ